MRINYYIRVKKLSIITFFLDIIFAAVFIVFRFVPEVTEKYYSRMVFPFISGMLSAVTDKFSFSLTEILFIIFFILSVFIMPALMIIHCRKKKLNLLKGAFLFVRSYFTVFSFALIWFYTVWGFNYFRPPVSITSGRKTVTDAEFNEAVKKIIKKSNNLYMINPYKSDELNIRLNREISRYLKDKYNVKTAERIKFFKSKILERTNTLGFISPFLLESHISEDILESEKPSVVLHEKSHLYGIANETEANYTAFASCLSSDDGYFKYSGYFDILYYFLAEYKKRNSSEDYKKTIDSVRPEIREEFKKQQERYKKNKTAFSEFTMKVYNIYLKANKIKEGNEAYSKVIYLILNSGILENNP